MAQASGKSMRIAKKTVKYTVLSLLGITVVFPFYILIMESFHPNLVVLPYPVELLPKYFSLSNYAYLFKAYPVFRWIVNSLVISVGTSVLQVVLCSMAAFGFGRTEFRFRRQIYGALMLMLVVPIQTRILPLFIFMSQVGWINTFLAWVPFCVDAFGIFLMIQFMESIPKDLDEAALMDGANLFTTYSQVILPQTKPAMVVLLTFNFINQWNDFLYPLIAVRNDKMYTLQLGLANIFSSAQRGEGGGIGVALAGAVVSFLPTLIIFLLFQNNVVQGMNISAGIKG